MFDEENGMPAKRELTMRQLRYLLRLHHDGVSAREIGRLLGVARSTIQDNLKRAAAAGLQWPLADDVTDEVLEQRLFGRAAIAAGQRRRIEPDWADLARELKRPGVTMMVLWEEYREAHREGYGYSRFCDLLRGFERRLTPVMRQHHVAGDKAFVDYSGKRIGIADPATGEIREAEIFVGVLGASNLTYAEATWTQQLLIPTSCVLAPWTCPEKVESRCYNLVRRQQWQEISRGGLRTISSERRFGWWKAAARASSERRAIWGFPNRA